MEVLTVKQAAHQLQVARTTIYGLCAQRKLAHVRVGAGGRGTIRIPAESLAAFVAGASVRADAQHAPTPTPVRLKHQRV